MDGLTSLEAKKKLAQLGPNEVVAKRDFGAVKLLLSQLESPLVVVMLVTSLAAFLVRDAAATIVILVAVAMNVGLGFFQEYRAHQALAALKKFLVSQAKVVRDGQQQLVDSREIVPGDAVVLTLGYRVPADGQLLEVADLALDEALLTGESVAVKKTTGDQIYAGATVAVGWGRMLVAKTGRQTRIGQMGKEIETTAEEKTPLQIQLNHFTHLIMAAVGLMAVVIFLLGLWRGVGFWEMLTVGVAVSVAAVPEGLVVVLTVILALSMQRILKKKAVMWRLVAAETLGSVSVICCDKTGTLTEGKTQVVAVEVTDRELMVKGALLCNDQRDALEIGMSDWALRQTVQGKPVNKDDLQKKYPRIDEIPFSSQTKMIATLHPGILFVSGAPEVVLDRCRLPAAEKEKWLQKLETGAGKGYRLVGFAHKKIENYKLKIENSSLEGLVWLGLILYEDPIKEGVANLLTKCRQAGIKVKIITGDYPETARVVRDRLGIKNESVNLTLPSPKLVKILQDGLIDGEELAQMSMAELKQVIAGVSLFARTSPEQKLKIVQALKENGEVVAMMGDGINDALALKKADIGIVVNEAVDVAKETADMVLLDKNLGTILYAIEEGRGIFANFKKVIFYFLTDATIEIVLVSAALILQLPLPLMATQILWVDLLIDLLPGMALAFEPLETNLMSALPRPRKAPLLDFGLQRLILSAGTLFNVVLLALLFWLRQHFDLAFTRTMMFAALGLNSLLLVFVSRQVGRRHFRFDLLANKVLLGATAMGVALLLAALYLPVLQNLLGTQPLSGSVWVFLLSLSALSWLLAERLRTLLS